MKSGCRFGLLVLCAAMCFPAAFAQTGDKDHGNFGVYFDYTRLQFAKLNLFGVGGRVGINVHPHIALEGEMAYDFARSTRVDAVCIPEINCSNLRSELRLI